MYIYIYICILESSGRACAANYVHAYIYIYMNRYTHILYLSETVVTNSVHNMHKAPTGHTACTTFGGEAYMPSLESSVVSYNQASCGRPAGGCTFCYWNSCIICGQWGVPRPVFVCVCVFLCAVCFQGSQCDAVCNFGLVFFCVEGLRNNIVCF